MIKVIIFDTDGVVIRRESYFSVRLSNDFDIPIEEINPLFFSSEFRSCLEGKADLRKVLENYLNAWKWTKGIDALLEYWFASEKDQDVRILDSVLSLKKRGIRCFLDMNNEKYRTAYLLKNVGLANRFEGVFSSAHLGVSKPSPFFWEAIHQHLGLPDKKEVLVWDDDEKNVKSAQNFGFTAEHYTDFESYQKKLDLLLP